MKLSEIIIKSEMLRVSCIKQEMFIKWFSGSWGRAIPDSKQIGVKVSKGGEKKGS